MANVWTWLVYNSTGLKTAIQGAIDQQNAEGLTQAPVRLGTVASNASLMTDLALARADLADSTKTVAALTDQNQ